MIRSSTEGRYASYSITASNAINQDGDREYCPIRGTTKDFMIPDNEQPSTSVAEAKTRAKSVGKYGRKTLRVPIHGSCRGTLLLEKKGRKAKATMVQPVMPEQQWLMR